MTDTVHLGLPFIAAAQAQKHVTHNEALRILDALVQLAVLDRDLAAPPGAPNEGERWIVAAGATGAWSGHADHIAAWQDGAWRFATPQAGWCAYVADEGRLMVWTGAAWADLAATVTVLQNLVRLGIGTTADAGNPFSARLNNALWAARTVAEGGSGDLRCTLSKESAADTLALLFQSNFSGRAEIGLLGNDDLAIKVSPDGSQFFNAVVVDKDSGAVALAAPDFIAARSANQAEIGFHVLEEILSGLSGPTVDSSIQIPNGAIVFNVSERVTATITGATSFSVGTAAEAGKFGSGLGVSAGSTNLGVIGPTAFYADTPIRLTAGGGAFSGGAVRLAIHCYLPQAPQS